MDQFSVFSAWMRVVSLPWKAPRPCPPEPLGAQLALVRVLGCFPSVALGAPVPPLPAHVRASVTSVLLPYHGVTLLPRVTGRPRQAWPSPGHAVTCALPERTLSTDQDSHVSLPRPCLLGQAWHQPTRAARGFQRTLPPVSETRSSLGVRLGGPRGLGSHCAWKGQCPQSWGSRGEVGWAEGAGEPLWVEGALSAELGSRGAVGWAEGPGEPLGVAPTESGSRACCVRPRWWGGHSSPNVTYVAASGLACGSEGHQMLVACPTVSGWGRANGVRRARVHPCVLARPYWGRGKTRAARLCEEPLLVADLAFLSVFSQAPVTVRLASR